MIADDPGHVVATLSGPGAALLLHLWKRADDTGLAWSGDADAGRATLAAAITA